MRLTDDLNENDNRSGLPVVYMMIGAAFFVIILIVVVVAANSSGIKKKKPSAAAVTETETVDAGVDADLIGGSDLRAEDLDFWNMYKGDEPVSANSVISDKSYEERMKELEEEESKKEEEEDLSEGGTKTKVIRPDGAEQWIMINAYINKNPYKPEGFVYKDPMMKYYADGKNQSLQGLILHEKSGSADYALLKEAGIQYVMIRIGYRGYESGVISEDKQFKVNFESAIKANVPLGIYFESAAVTDEEAKEEAAFVLKTLSDETKLLAGDGAADQAAGVNPAAGNAENTQNTADPNAQNAADPNATQNAADSNTQNGQNDQEGADLVDTVIVEQIGEPVTADENMNNGQQTGPDGNPVMEIYQKSDKVIYPVFIKFGQPANHSARTDNMPKTVLSQVANVFMREVKQTGYKQGVWGDKYWLLRRLDLTQLDLGTEIVLQQNEETPDYPYEFAMWQYKSDGQLSGIKGDAQMIMSFVDYERQ